MNEIEYNAWIKRTRQLLCKIVTDVPDEQRVNKFVWFGRNSSQQRIGCIIMYATGFELTASILEWWFCQDSHSGAPFFLRDLIDAIGVLWDKAVEDLCWPHLAGASHEQTNN